MYTKPHCSKRPRQLPNAFSFDYSNSFTEIVFILTLMKTAFVFLAAAVLLVSCRKEGLSKDTGNLEVTVTKNLYGFYQYRVYTEDQYYKLQTGQLAVPLFKGDIGADNKFSVKEMEKGYYAVYLIGSGGWNSTKVLYIKAKKTNKLEMP